MFDEFVVYGRGTADPWHRVNCCHQPTFLFIEFCQVIGPKPLFWCPEHIGPHLDLDQVALWVMSSENLHGSVTCMYNQQLGLYALSIYSTIFDLTARAFQRPFALVLLSNSKPTPSAVQLFQNKCIQFLRLFLACNRQYFLNSMKHLFHMADNIDSESFRNYYTVLSGTMQLPIMQNFIRGLQLAASRARVWYNCISDRKHLFITADSKCDCGFELCEFEKFLLFFSAHSTSSYLTPIIELAPCVQHNLFQSFLVLYNDLLAVDHLKGVLFSNKTPILRSFIGANFAYTNDDDDEEEKKTGSKNEKCSNFRRFSSGFVNGISHLFAGERIAVLASSHKEYFGIQMLRKLNSLRISKRVEKAIWYGHLAERTVSGERQLAGFVCNSSNSPDWMHPCYPIVIDLNFLRVKCQEYSGRFLKPLMQAVMHSFPSDESVMDFVVSILTDIQQFTVLAKYISPRTVIDRLNMSQADQLIFINNLVELNVVKYSFLKKELEKFPFNPTQLKQIRF